MLDRENEKVYFRGAGPAMIILNDIQILDYTYSPVALIPPELIESVSVIKGRTAFGRYGGGGDIVFVTTKTGLEEQPHKKNEDLL